MSEAHPAAAQNADCSSGDGMLLVAWNRDGLHKPRSAAPDWQGGKSEHILGICER
jgi:hypothetical protein